MVWDTNLCFRVFLGSIYLGDNKVLENVIRPGCLIHVVTIH
jgi:hypothetical protein